MEVIFVLPFEKRARFSRVERVHDVGSASRIPRVGVACNR
jgi:hypothetical protein